MKENIFLYDALRAGLRIIYVPIKIASLLDTESTWFNGYTEKFFFDRGVLYHFLYGKAAFIWGFRFLFKNNDNMCNEMGFFKCYKLLMKGVKHGKGLKKV